MAGQYKYFSLSLAEHAKEIEQSIGFCHGSSTINFDLPKPGQNNNFPGQQWAEAVDWRELGVRRK